MSKVARFHQTGGPEVIQIDDMELDAPQPDEVLISIKSIGLNRAESMFRMGQYLESPILPARFGYEAAGVVEKLGSAVDQFEVGDKVNVIPSFSMNQYGTCAEKALLPAYSLVKQPDGLSDNEAAAVWMQYLTVWGALIEWGNLQSGQTVLIPAASSSVGLAAIQITNMMDAIPVAITRRADKKAALLKLGARHVIISESQNISEQVRLLTAGKGADVIFDPVAGPALNHLAESAGQFARLIIYGALSTEVSLFPLLPALAKGLTFRGYTLFEITQNPQLLAKGVKFVEQGLLSAKLQPVIAKTFPFEEIKSAYQYLESNQQIGKIIVNIHPV